MGERLKVKHFDLSSAQTVQEEKLPGGARYLRAHHVPAPIEIALDPPQGPDDWITVDQPGNICADLEEPLDRIWVRWAAASGTFELLFSASVVLDFEGGRSGDDAGDLIAHIVPGAASPSTTNTTDLVSGRQNTDLAEELGGTSHRSFSWIAAVDSAAIRLRGTGVLEEIGGFRIRGMMPVGLLNPHADREAAGAGYYEIENTVAVAWPNKVDYFRAWFGIGWVSNPGGVTRSHGFLWELSASGGATIILRGVKADFLGASGNIAVTGDVRSTGAGDSMENVPWRLGLRIGARANGEPFVQFLFDGSLAGELTGELAADLIWDDNHEPVVAYGLGIGDAANDVIFYSLLNEGLTIRYVRTNPPVAP